ncbi:hypothetical protein E3N88_23339 [Mikania micrantha]|uniref:Integrase catalytic domain-containing protein n=1 Tax=Mikania micrantha TaxID=192012 RepID=A0A5N6NFQ3_9ASTR|nr:hypothetical protein E3N88_23339 [Mikania micrantha]
MDAWKEGLKEESVGFERILGQIKSLEENEFGVKTQFGRVSVREKGATVKAEHQKLYGYVQHLEVPEWKWEHITISFITKLPLTAKRRDTIWVILDRLTNIAHFLPICETYTLKNLSELLIKEIVTRHGILVSIVSNRDTRFISLFWKQFDESMGTRLNIIIAYRPQINGQCERIIQILEHMLGTCIIDFGGSWNDHLPLVEFSYTNGYHANIGMPHMRHSTNDIVLVKVRIKAAHDHQVKVQWKHQKGSEATWETENEIKRLYSHLFEM